VGGWLAELDVALDRSARGVHISHLRHLGPLRIQRPFHPEGRERPHVYLLHPPGGLVSGDRLVINVRAGEGSAGLVTAPGATKAYRSSGLPARQNVVLDLAPGASLEWLPHEVIAFDGARLEATHEVRLEAGARYFGWEVLCLGRPASGDVFRDGHLDLRQQVYVDGRPVLMERALWNEQTLRWRNSPATLRGHTHVATVMAWPAEVGLIENARMPAPPPGLASSGGMVDGLYVHRVLASGLPELRRHLHALWAALRPLVLGIPACPPRIWAT
jgi:urease accessory protein